MCSLLLPCLKNVAAQAEAGPKLGHLPAIHPGDVPGKATRCSAKQEHDPGLVCCGVRSVDGGCGSCPVQVTCGLQPGFGFFNST